MERSVISISILVLACLLGSAAALSGTNVSAYWVNFFAIENDYDMNAANAVYCATWDADKPYEWRSKYNWTAYCSPDGPQGEEACGLCLNITNTRTGDQTTVRIVSTCNSNALDLDKPVFDQLDTDGNGDTVGHLTVDYEFVDCGDTKIRLYSGH